MITKEETWDTIKSLHIEELINYINTLENAFERACEDLATLDEYLSEDDYKTSFQWKDEILRWVYMR